MSYRNQTKVAIVTGSTQGIGKGIAHELAASGITVVVTSRRIEHAEQTAAEITSLGGNALGIAFNLEETDRLETLIEDTINACGRLDVLVNNALSQSSVLPLDTLSQSQIAFAFTSNITNTFLLNRAAYPHLKESKGNIINIGSVIVNRHVLGLPIYAIVKGALIQMTKALAAEWADDGIRVNAINPGFIYTSALSYFNVPEDIIEKNYNFYKQYHALKRIGNPEEIGKTAAYLASDDAGFVTGSVIDIDGGYSIQAIPMYPGD